MLTAEQIKLLEELGFKKRTVKTKATSSYVLWEKEIKPNNEAQNDAIIVVHVIEGEIYKVSIHQDTYAPKEVTDEVESINAKLREGGIV